MADSGLFPNLKSVKRCSRCGHAKQADEFGYDKARPDGLNVYCRECTREVSRARNKRLRAERDALADQGLPTFRCTGCDQEKPVRAFRRNAWKPRGFSTRCRECEKTRAHARAAISIALIAANATKTCRTCEVEKPLSEFVKDLRQRDGRCTRCRPCASAYAEKWRDRRRRGEETSKPVVPQRRAFGVLETEYDEMLQAQHYACAICASPFERKKPNKNINIDHDHKTLRVRGLLCTPCNLGLGSFKDSRSLLKCAIDYLEIHSDGKSG